MFFLGILLQEPDSISSGDSKLLTIFVGLVALSMLTQAIVFVVAAVAAIKVKNRLLAIVEEVKHKTLPVIDSTQSVIHELHPKVRTIAENLVETSHVVRAKAQEVESTISDVNHRARAQSARVDDMFTSVLDTTSGIASTIQKGVQVPVREFHGLMNGIKAGIDVLVGRKGNHATDRDHRYEAGASPYSSGAKPYSARYREDDPTI
jgi:uncharacterized protein YoxC